LKAPPISTSGHSGFPVVAVVVLGAMLVIGWAAFRLAKTEPAIWRERQKAQESEQVFRKCQELFRASLSQPELARQKSDLAWQERLRLKSEYHRIAEKIASHLTDLDQALRESTNSQVGPELQQRLHELGHWIQRQNDRVGVEHLAARSRELMERITRSSLPRTNGTATVANGQVIYTPNTGYTGLDSFTYTVSDGKGGTATATVTITVTLGGQPMEHTVYLPVIQN